MALISRLLRNWAHPSQGTKGLTYWCPGCNQPHSIITEGPHAWTWNGNAEAPVFRPSVLVRTGHYSDRFKQGDDCWCTYYAEHPEDKADDGFKCMTCHVFIGGAAGDKAGKIEFLSDCTHALAGQTVDMVLMPRSGWDSE